MVMPNLDPKFAFAKDLSSIKHRITKLENRTIGMDGGAGGGGFSIIQLSQLIDVRITDVAGGEILSWNDGDAFWENVDLYALINRQIATLTTPTLAPQETITTTISMAAGYHLYNLTTDIATRVRLYTTTTGQATDLNRRITLDPYDGVGCLLDYGTNPSLMSIDLAPQVEGYTNNGAIDVPITVTNLSAISTPINVLFVYLQNE